MSQNNFMQNQNMNIPNLVNNIENNMLKQSLKDLITAYENKN